MSSICSDVDSCAPKAEVFFPFLEGTLDYVEGFLINLHQNPIRAEGEHLTEEPPLEETYAKVKVALDDIIREAGRATSCDTKELINRKVDITSRAVAFKAYCETVFSDVCKSRDIPFFLHDQ